MAGLGDTLAGGGIGVGAFNQNVNDAYAEGQKQTANAQLAAYRQMGLRQEALNQQMRQRSAQDMPGGVMPPPNIAGGSNIPYNEPVPPPPPPITARMGRNPYETNYTPQPPPEPSYPPTTAVVPPGFTQPPTKPGAPAKPPKRTPYGANGRGLDFSFAPPMGNTGNAVRPSQSDVRTFDQETNPEVKPYAPPEAGMGSPQQLSGPSAYSTTPVAPGQRPPQSDATYGAYISPQQQQQMDLKRQQILMQEIADNPASEPYIGAELGTMQDRQRQAGNENVGLPVPPPSGPTGAMPYVAATTPPVGAAPTPLAQGSPHVGSYDSTLSAPPASSEPSGATTQAPALSNNLPTGREFIGGHQGRDQHYDFYDQLAQQQTRMAQYAMLSGDTQRADASIAQANMARLEQYNILSTQALHAARRGDPTQLLSIMNVYDPNGGYSVRGTRNGGVQVLSNGSPLATMSQDEFLNSAQMLVSKAYYDEMFKLRMKMAYKQFEVGTETQGKMAVADVEGSWKVREMQTFAQSKGLTPTVDSANNMVYAHGVGQDGKTHFYLVKPGVPIGGDTKLLTSPTLQEISQ